MPVIFPEISNSSWTPITQRIVIFSKLVFDEAEELAQLIQGTQTSNPKKKVKLGAQNRKSTKNYSNLKPNEFGELLSFKNEVSIPFLAEVMAKNTPLDAFTVFLIENLLPPKMKSKDSESSDWLRLAQVKITQKVAQFNYEVTKFVNELDINMNGQLQLHELFTELACQHSIYFSLEEQNAIHEHLFIVGAFQKAHETANERKTKIVVLGNEAPLSNRQPNDQKSPAKQR